MKLATLWILAALLASVPAARAQIVAPGGRTLFNRAVMLRTVVRLDTFDEAQPGHRLRRITDTLALVWGVHPNLSLSFVTPFVIVDSQDRDHATGDSTISGTGDSTFFVRYDLYRRNVPQGFTRLSPEVGVKLATGGAFGTGSTDPIAGLVFSHVRDPHWLIADLQLTSPSTGDNDLRRGNRWRYDVAYLYRLLPRDGLGLPTVMLVLELNGESVEHSRREGISLPETGGDTLFVSPGVELILSNRLVLELSLPVPVLKDLNGSQPKPNSSLILGLRWLF